MKIVSSIVSIGGWNPKIFSPGWVAMNVFQIPQGASMQCSFDESNMTLLFSWNDVHFSITEKGIELRTEAFKRANLKYMDAVYKHLVAMLQYTPISAFGYNINVTLSKEEFLSLPVSRNLQIQNVNGYAPSSVVLSASEGNVLKSFDIRIKGAEYEIRSNFHFAHGKQMDSDGVVFDDIVKEFKSILGYELSL